MNGERRSPAVDESRRRLAIAKRNAAYAIALDFIAVASSVYTENPARPEVGSAGTTTPMQLTRRRKFLRGYGPLLRPLRPDNLAANDQITRAGAESFGRSGHPLLIALT